MEPKDIVRHELIGLEVRITDSTNPGVIGTAGRVVDESRNTLSIEVGGKPKNFIKDQCIFSFRLPGRKETWVRVDGKLLVARPEDRIKKRFKKW